MGKNGHQSCLPDGIFAIFCDVSRCKRCNAMSRNMYIFYRGGLTYERGGDARRKFWKTPKGDQPGRGPTFFWPLKETILLQSSLVIDVIENFDYTPITVKPCGGKRAVQGVGMWHFSKICSQIPCPRANHSSQLHPNLPTLGCTLLSNIPKQNPRKAQ